MIKKLKEISDRINNDTIYEMYYTIESYEDRIMIYSNIELDYKTIREDYKTFKNDDWNINIEEAEKFIKIIEAYSFGLKLGGKKC